MQKIYMKVYNYLHCSLFDVIKKIKVVIADNCVFKFPSDKQSIIIGIP